MNVGVSFSDAVWTLFIWAAASIPVTFALGIFWGVVLWLLRNMTG